MEVANRSETERKSRVSGSTVGLLLQRAREWAQAFARWNDTEAHKTQIGREVLETVRETSNTRE